MSAKTLETFLEGKGKTIKFLYGRGIQLFSEWYKKDVDTILNERKDDLTPKPNENIVDAKFRADRFERELEKFHAWLLEPIHMIKGKQNQAYNLNTARVYSIGIMQLFRYYAMPMTLRTGSPISQTQVSLGDFVLKTEHVRAMFHVAKDLRSKLLISLANDLGWRIGDFLSIRVSELPNLEQDTPIEWLRITEKEKVLAKTCLSKDTVALLKEYLFTFGLKGDSYLFYSNGSHSSEESVNRRLRDLAQDAEINLNGKTLRFHCFRKMIISEAKNLRIDPDIIKLMVGKKVKSDMLTYMTGINVKQAFETLQTVTHINGEILIRQKESEFGELKDKLTEFEQAMTQLEGENSALKTRIDNLQKRLEELPKEVSDKIFKALKEMGIAKDLLEKKRKPKED